MVRVVLNMEIISDKPAKIAKHFVIAHVLIFLTAALAGALVIIADYQMRPALDDVFETRGEYFKSISRLWILAIYVGRFMIPGGLILMACLAIRGNDKWAFRCLEYIDGIGVCLQIAGLVLAILFVEKTDKLRSDMFYLNCWGYFDDVDEVDIREKCLSASGFAIETLSVCYDLSIASAVMSALSVVACLFAALQARAGHQALRRGEVFVAKPLVGQVVGSPVQPPQEIGAKQLAV